MTAAVLEIALNINRNHVNVKGEIVVRKRNSRCFIPERKQRKWRHREM
jgi:hypothetical protein